VYATQLLTAAEQQRNPRVLKCSRGCALAVLMIVNVDSVLQESGGGSMTAIAFC